MSHKQFNTVLFQCLLYGVHSYIRSGRLTQRYRLLNAGRNQEHAGLQTFKGGPRSIGSFSKDTVTALIDEKQTV